MYINAHTYYSLRYGIMSVEELLAEAANRGVETFALTDINNTSASLDFVRLAPKHNIRPVLGMDIRNGAQRLYIAIAQDNKGFQEINEFISPYLHAQKKIPVEAPDFKRVLVIYPFELVYKKLRAFEYVGIRPEDLTRLPFSQWVKHLNKLVVLQPATFRNKRDFNTHRLLRAIAKNTLLSKLEKSEEAREIDLITSVSELKEHFSEYPQIISNTQKLLEKCSIYFEFGDQYKHKNQQNYTESAEKDMKLIKALCAVGIKYRYKKPGKKEYARLEKELKIIAEKGFIAYFLINWDIVKYARSREYFYVGRGSGANSIVAYCLRITDVDPIDLDLYFERFINLYRKNPPDFDLDFSWKDRDDVTSYIFNRFRHVVLIATYNTFQYRAIVRELGKVFGLPKREIDVLSDGRYNYSKLDNLARLVLKYGSWIKGFPSHLSVHAGGILISEAPVHSYTATDFPPKGFPITHFDMVVAEDAGLYKFDILSQRGLGKIKDALAIVDENQPLHEPYDIHDIDRFKKDEAIKSLLRQGKAIGCFYVESPAMRMLLKKLEVDTYLGLVAASSIIRPGVARSGMMREYIVRFRNPQLVEERAHPIMLEIMPETYGVMVYQEDVIKVAHYFADLTLEEADHLRRGMSGKFRSRDEFQKAKESFFINCRKKGEPMKAATEVWNQIESFAGYAFSKGHSASYAVESYQSLFLKAYYPLEYMVAVINNFGGFYRTELYVHEARMHGAQIEAPCVNESRVMTHILGKVIYLGLSFVSDLDSSVAVAIVEERLKEGPFEDLPNLVTRVSVSLEQVSLLIRVGAFRFTGKNKKALLWQAHFLLANTGKSVVEANLFSVPTKQHTLPPLQVNMFEDAFDEIELLGFPLCNPFDLLKHYPLGEVLVNDMERHEGQVIMMVGYYVHRKTTTTIKKEMMHFGTFLDRKGYFLDTVHFPPVVAQYPFRGRGIYQLEGKIIKEFGFFSMEVQKMEILSIIPDARYSED